MHAEAGTTWTLQKEECRLMGYISRAIDRLPKWAQWIVMAIGILFGIYGVARYGFWFLIKVIFSPDL